MLLCYLGQNGSPTPPLKQWAETNSKGLFVNAPTDDEFQCAWADFVAAKLLLDKSANHYIWEHILELPLKQFCPVVFTR